METLQKIQLSNYFRIDSADDFDAKFEQTAQILGAIESALPIDIMNANYTMNNSTFIQVSSQLAALNRLVNDDVELASLYNAHRGLMGDSVMTNVSVYLFQFYKALVEKKGRKTWVRRQKKRLRIFTRTSVWEVGMAEQSRRLRFGESQNLFLL